MELGKIDWEFVSRSAAAELRQSEQWLSNESGPFNLFVCLDVAITIKSRYTNTCREYLSLYIE
jgi:hypothetical protein